MRRNDGDAVSQHAEDFGKAFAGWRAAMRFTQHNMAEAGWMMSKT
jgi:hypothetical protein